MKNNHLPPKRTSDFGPGTEPHTIILKERTWRIEMSRTKAKRFLKKHKIATVATLAVIAAGIVTQYVLVGLASTADFYPSSCLGNWENVQNALGKPDLAPGASASAFTSLNSAVFGTSTAQMFCGNFSGDTDITTLTGKSFQEADVVLSWSFAFPPAAPVAADEGAPASTDVSSTIPAADASSTLIITTSTDTSSTTASSTPDAVIATTTPTSTTESLLASSSTENSSAENQSSTSNSATTTTATTTPVSPGATDSSASDTSDSTTVVLPPPPAPAPTDNGTASDTSPTSWIKRLIGVAYADMTSSTDDSASTTELASSSTIADATSAQQQPISMDTSVFQNIALPSSTPNAILAIVYSTDGVTWQPLADIDSTNWQQARYKIPISSWQELEHLQVAFIGLGASSSPQVYLDAAGVEVSYVDAPEAAPSSNIDPISDQPLSTPSSSAPASDVTTPAPPPAPAVSLPPPAEALKNAFSPWAAQTCAVDPFSASVARGNTAAFLLKLIPRPKATSSIQGSSSSPSFLYDAAVGTLPAGVSADITTSGSGNDTIVAQAGNDAVPGSYSVVVVYRERQADGTILPNYCQFDLEVE